MITLAIVGVVAAITLPPLITNIQSQVKAKRVQNIKQKFSKATDKMLAMSGMNGYGSTENFVNELQNHLKIAKVCDNNHLAECWGYSTMLLSHNRAWEVNKTSTAKYLQKLNKNNEDWDNTMGIVASDGTSMILSYNKKCNMTMDVNPQWHENQSSSADCVAAIFDWNGAKGPNMFDHSDQKHIEKSDIILLNSDGIGPECNIYVNKKCFKYPIYNTAYLTNEQCLALQSELGLPHCPTATGGIDYFGAAVQKCGNINNVASESDLSALARLITTNGSLSVSMGFPDTTNSKFFIWSHEYVYNKDYACAYLFKNSTSEPICTHASNARNQGKNYILCKSD